MSFADPQHVQALPAAPAMAPPAALPPSFATLAAELRLRAGDGTGQGAQPALHALVLLGLIRVLWVLESMVRHWQSARPTAAGHTILAARYPRARQPRPARRSGAAGP